MNKIELKKEDVQAAYLIADENTKKVLNALFGEIESKPTPTLGDHTTIKSYEDACEALGEPLEVFFEGVPSHIEALMKLETISRALWGKEFKPKPDPEGKEMYWHVWFVLYTKEEIENMSEEEMGAFFGGRADNGASAGFGHLSSGTRSSCSYAYNGFRLCQETEEKSLYFGRQFIELWYEYLLNNLIKED